MRTLRFIVDQQTIKCDPNCSLEGLVPGATNYLKAEFIFSSDWNGCAKVAAFYSPLGRELPPQVLEDGKTCVIPMDALVRRSFKIQLVGRKGDLQLTTNKVEVRQGGKV